VRFPVLSAPRITQAIVRRKVVAELIGPSAYDLHYILPYPSVVDLCQITAVQDTKAPLWSAPVNSLINT